MTGKPAWGGALAIAARLGVPPEAFWRLSVVEWRAIAASPGSAPMSRGELEALMRTHPDGR